MAIKKIASASNQYLKHVKKLMIRKSYRLLSGQFVVEGKRLVEDALGSGVIPDVVLLSGPFADRAAEYEKISPCVYVLPEALMRSLSDTETPQGIAAVCPLRAEPPLNLKGNKFVLLDSLQDPGNVGSILRTAAALGVSRVLITADCADLYSPKVLRASMGGVFRVPCSVVSDAVSTIENMRKEGICVFAAALDPGAVELGESTMTGRVCVVIGNEGAGIGSGVMSVCDGAVMLPMRGGIQSLNAAAAATIFIWEMTRDI